VFSGGTTPGSRHRRTLRLRGHNEVLQQFVEMSVLRADSIKWTLADKSAEIAAAHSLASRYGRG
jgi:hypothetical protein